MKLKTLSIISYILVQLEKLVLLILTFFYSSSSLMLGVTLALTINIGPQVRLKIKEVLSRHVPRCACALALDNKSASDPFGRGPFNQMHAWCTQVCFFVKLQAYKKACLIEVLFNFFFYFPLISLNILLLVRKIISKCILFSISTFIYRHGP